MRLRQLRRIRWAVRATLTLGVLASTCANVLHAEHNAISRTIAGWPPIALLLTVELISRVPVHRRSLAFVRLAATAAIAAIAAWVSYWHMVGVIARYGETGAGPYLIPLTVDGLIVVASVCLVEVGGRLRAIAEAAPSEAEPVTSGKPDLPGPSLATRSAPSRPPMSPAAAGRSADRPSKVHTVTYGKVKTAGSREADDKIRLPQSAETLLQWAKCWMGMCRDGLATGPISNLADPEVKNRYGWGVKQLRYVRRAATSGELRRQAELLGVELPGDYRDSPMPPMRINGANPTIPER